MTRDQVRTFYASLRPPVLVGLEATGSMWWFLQLLEELGIAGARASTLAAVRTNSSVLVEVVEVDGALRGLQQPHHTGHAPPITPHSTAFLSRMFKTVSTLFTVLTAW